MRKISILFAAAALALALGCNNNNGQPTSAYNSNQPAATNANNLTPEQLGELGAKIKRHPKDAEKILSDAGLTEPSFEQAVRKVAEHPDDAKRYAAAYKKAV